MGFWAYILHCRGGAFYTGHTDNLAYRIAQHESGTVTGFTSDKLPVVLVWSQEFSTRIEALEAERRIKGWSRAKKMAPGRLGQDFGFSKKQERSFDKLRTNG